MDYFSFMNRSQIKQALINCAKTHGMSLSEFASEAGVSPSTLTGFVNDISTRADHVLSMRTIGKLTLRFPDLSTFLQLAEPAQELQEVRFLGLIDLTNKWQIVPLDPGSKGSIMCKNFGQEFVAFGVKSHHPLYERRVYFCHPETISDKKIFKDYLARLVVVDSDKGKHMGYFLQDTNGKWYTSSVPVYPEYEHHEKLIDLDVINWIMPVDWIQP